MSEVRRAKFFIGRRILAMEGKNDQVYRQQQDVTLRTVSVPAVNMIIRKNILRMLGTVIGLAMKKRVRF